MEIPKTKQKKSKSTSHKRVRKLSENKTEEKSETKCDDEISVISEPSTSKVSENKPLNLTEDQLLISEYTVKTETVDFTIVEYDNSEKSDLLQSFETVQENLSSDSFTLLDDYKEKLTETVNISPDEKTQPHQDVNKTLEILRLDEKLQLEESENEIYETKTTILEKVDLKESEMKQESSEKSKLVESDNEIETTAVFKDETKTTASEKLKLEEPSMFSEMMNVIKPFTETQLASLYTNPELEQATLNFVHEFIENELKCEIAKNHYLYELLINYLCARNKLLGYMHEINTFKKECAEIQTQFWSLEKARASKNGLCEDGNAVVAVHEYRVARFHENVVKLYMKKLSIIKDTIHELYVLYSYSTEVIKLQIEHYINTIISSCLNIGKVAYNACPALVVSDSGPSIPGHLINDLRLSLSVLFIFQRRPISDSVFVNTTRGWLNQLAAVLLRFATWRDHMFLLNHILRCPSGVSSWASHLIQVPCPRLVNTSSPFSDHHIHHCVAVLATIILPIQQRDAFLSQIEASMNSHDVVTEQLWVLVDSEGEETDEENAQTTALRESDLISVLDQLPLANLFKNLLFIETRDEKDNFDASNLSEHHILRLIAWSSVFTWLLGRGLHTYPTPRYRQLAKRLCRLIRHTVQYTSDAWQSYSVGPTGDPAMVARVQVEYDSLVIRAACSLLRARPVGAGQFLAVVPYDAMSPSALWCLFYILHTDEPNAELVFDVCTDYKLKLNDVNVQSDFEERISEMNEQEIYYLLQTFASMALARSNSEQEFIKTASLDLLKIGFFVPSTQDTCSKHSRDLLASITTNHPNIISDILQGIKDKFKTIEHLGSYLFKELSLKLWHPTDVDTELIFHWLLHCSPPTHESTLARLILSNLNWDFLSNGMLFLPHALHFQTAIILVAATFRYESEFSSIWKDWAWNLLPRLRLHVFDRGFTVAQQMFTCESASLLRKVPELEKHDVLLAGIKDNQPIACVVVLLATQWGHSIPLLCGHGFNLLTSTLLPNERYSMVLIILHRVIPLFLDCIESLVKCERFIDVVIQLLSVDQTYIKMAKSLIIAGSVGPVLKQFCNMLQNQLNNYQQFGLSSPKLLVSLWLQCLTTIPNWTHDSNVLQLINIVLQSAFFSLEAISVAREILTASLQQYMLSQNQSSGTLSTLLSWMSNSGNVPTLLGAPVCVPWLAYIALDIEHTELELRPGVWKELLKQLADTVGKTNVNGTLKKVCNSLNVPFRGSNYLCLYRWAQTALDTPIEHPLLPLLWQKFFLLFFARVPITSRLSDRGGVGDKFFDGMINLSFHKKLKKRLQEIIVFYRTSTETSEVTENGSEHVYDNRKTYHLKCLQLFSSFALWLEESRLHEPNFTLPALPPQYNSQKLIHIFQGNTDPWLEYLDYEQIKSNSKLADNEWKSICKRDKRTQDFPTNTSTDSCDPRVRLLKRLSCYETPQMAPPLPQVTSESLCIIPTEILFSSTSVINTIKPHLKSIKDYIQKYNMRLSEHTAVDCTFGELIPQLYQDHTTTLTMKIACKEGVSESGTNRSRSNRHCSGPATIRIKITQGVVNETIERQIQTNRGEYEQLVKQSMNSPPEKVCQASLFIEQTVNLLQHEFSKYKMQGNTDNITKIHKVGVEMFYYLLSQVNEENNLCPPSKQLFLTCIEKLGQSFIATSDTNVNRLLKTAMERPILAGLLAPHLNPNTEHFLTSYETLIEGITCVGNEITSPDVAFVLLSKFDVTSWLGRCKPRLNNRSRFIQLVLKALSAMGLTPPEDQLMLHGVLRRHLLLIFCHEWPEHYGEVLQGLLACSGGNTGNVSPCVWSDVLRALGLPDGTCTTNLRNELRHYATLQQLLGFKELMDSASLLGRHFLQERLQWGLHGLYPRYRPYVEVLTTLFSLIGHGLVVSSVQAQPGLLADKLCEQIWPALSEMWSPWLAPYWSRSLKDCSAAWIQQLTDDRSVLLPWSPSDGPHAQCAINGFVETVRFVIDTLPACSNAMSFVWQFYATSFAYGAIKGHILGVIHVGLLTLPWNKFWPCLQDLELMLKIIEQYLPDCHTLLGSVVVHVPWTLWMSSVPPGPALTRVHCCLFPLFVKLAYEPTLRQNERLSIFLKEVIQFNWHLVDSNSFEQLINWYIMSSDVKVVLPVPESQKEDVDHVIFQLVQITAELYSVNNTQFTVSPNAIKKRKIYVKAYNRLLVCGSNKNKNQPQTEQFSNSIKNMLDLLEATVHAHPAVHGQAISEASALAQELLNLADDKCMSQVFNETASCWLQSRTKQSVMLTGVLCVLGTVPQSPSATGALFESCIHGYFSSRQGTWMQLIEIIKPGMPRSWIETFAKEGRALALHAVFMKDTTISFTEVVDMISLIKLDEAVEPKLPLLWDDLLRLSLQSGAHDETNLTSSLQRIADILQSCADERTTGWGETLLGAIGIRKSYILSRRSRLLCQCVVAFILVRLAGNNDPTTVQVVESIRLISKQQLELKMCIELMLTQIQDNSNPITNIRSVLLSLSEQLFKAPFLQGIGQ